MRDVILSQEIYDLFYEQLVLSIGLMFGTLLTGGLIAFGISCISLLSRNKNPDILKQHCHLRAYIIALLFIVMGYIIAEFLWCNDYLIFYLRAANEAERASRVLTLIINITPVFAVALSDGLLVWRCYMMQRLALCHNSARWQNIFWIFPAFLLGLTIVTGCIAAPLNGYYAVSQQVRETTRILQPIALLSNVALNVYAALFITIRLLKYRKITMTLIGEKVDTTCYLRIVNILLESAVINVPITITAAVGTRLDTDFGSAVIPVVIVGQAFASVIVIHQVAVGRALGQRQEEELSEFVVERGSSGNRLTETRSSLDI